MASGKGSVAMVSKSLSPLIRQSARAARQHSRTMLSSGSLLILSFLRGSTTVAAETTVAIPAMRISNCPALILPAAKSSCGTSRYSRRSSGETYRSASANAFLTARAGTPPNAKAETRTPVSITTLLFLRVRLPPDGFYRCFNVAKRERCFFEHLPRYFHGCLKPFVCRQRRKNEILGVYFFYSSSHFPS